MKKNIEITGILKIDSEKEIVVDLFSNGVKLDWFELNYKHKSINVELSNDIGKILKVDVNDYFDYIKLLDELGLEIPESYKKHWTPTLKDGTLWCYFVNSVGEIEGNWLSNSTFNNKLVANFNIFPNKELAEEAVNLSKLGRLILLWQYANDCLFEPDWKNNSQRKHFIKHDHINNTISCNFSITAQLDIVYFETSEQVEAFIKAYDKEIKKIMGVE